MKRLVAAIVTCALLAGALLLSYRRPSTGDDPQASTPADCIEQMFAAAERGDVQQYLSCFTGAEHARLVRQLADQPEEAFGRSLANAVSQLKGRVTLNSASRQEGDSAELVVERIYANRNEKQVYRLERRTGSWRIAEVRMLEVFQPEIPYGTPVYQSPPDDQP